MKHEYFFLCLNNLTGLNLNTVPKFWSQIVIAAPLTFKILKTYKYVICVVFLGFKGIWGSGLSMSAAMGVRDSNEASWTQVGIGRHISLPSMQNLIS